MITIENYNNEIRKYDLQKLPEALQKGHEFYLKSVSSYDESESIRKTINLYIGKLNEYLKYLTAGAVKAKPLVPVERPVKAVTKVKKEESRAKGVHQITEEVRFIKRFVGLHDKKKTPEQLLSFIKSLQRAIIQKRISKTSPHASDIKEIQDKLVKVYNENYRKQIIPIILDGKLLKKYEPITGSEKVYTSILYIRRFIGMQGGALDVAKVNSFLTQIKRAIDKGKLSTRDPYFSKVRSIANYLESALSRKEKTVSVSKAELNGLIGILNSCGCQDLGGIEEKVPVRPTGVMNSMDFIKVKFDKLGFEGKWKDFIGDPSKGFTVMIFGKPKFGKSYLCVEFAGYLARKHGHVLYVAKEEELDDTLQKKLLDTSVAHPQLDVSDNLPTDISKYDFIFIDSVSKLKLSPEELEDLKAKNPEKSFVYVFQVRKDGMFRGRNDFQHDVDVVIEVPEPGKAVQYGRFNQGGEMNIFDNEECVKF